MIHYQYWVRNKYLCTGHRYGTGPATRVRHNAFFCEECGEIWARKIITAVDLPHTISQNWYLDYKLCQKHGDGQLLSLWYHDFDTIVDDYPIELLTHEFIILYEKYFNA